MWNSYHQSVVCPMFIDLVLSYVDANVSMADQLC